MSVSWMETVTSKSGPFASGRNVAFASAGRSQKTPGRTHGRRAVTKPVREIRGRDRRAGHENAISRVPRLVHESELAVGDDEPIHPEIRVRRGSGFLGRLLHGLDLRLLLRRCRGCVEVVDRDFPETELAHMDHLDVRGGLELAGRRQIPPFTTRLDRATNGRNGPRGTSTRSNRTWKPGKGSARKSACPSIDPRPLPRIMPVASTGEG